MKLLVSLYDKVLGWSKHRNAARYLAIVSFAESSFFPIPPDFMLAPMTVAKPDRAMEYAFITSISSVMGGILGYLLGMLLFQPIVLPLLQLFNQEATYNIALEYFDKWGFIAVLIAGFSPIPYKLFTIGAGMMFFPFWKFVIGSLIARSLRFYLVAGLIKIGGARMESSIRTIIERLGWLMVLVVVGAAFFLVGCKEQPPAKIVRLAPGKKITHSSHKKITKDANVNKYHIVKGGDTLYSIAKDYKIDYRELARNNNISHPYPISVGQRITINPNVEPNIIKSKQTVSKKPEPRTPVLPSIAKTNPKNLPKRAWTWPAKGSQFATQRGLDIKGVDGAPIMAASNGEVVYSGNALRGYGNLIIIKHDQNFLTAYAHNRKNIVKEGEKVVMGQRIAEMGQTGTDSVKLHFEVRLHGKPIDPKEVLP